MKKLYQQLHNYKPFDEAEQQVKEQMLSDLKKFGSLMLTRDIDKHFTSSSIILNPELDQMLMVHHHIYQTWTWTGGHVDGEEDLLNVALREAKEETGLEEVKPLQNVFLSLEILPVSAHVKNGKNVPNHLHYNASFVFIASLEASIHPKFDENSAVKWVKVRDIPKYSNEPPMVELYLKIIKRAKKIKKC